jgi:hypothetical protein
MAHIQLGQEFWTIAKPISSEDPMQRPWKGVVQLIDEPQDCTKSFVYLSPLDPQTGHPDTSHEKTAFVPMEELFVNAMDAWVAYEKRLVDTHERLWADLTTAEEELQETTEIITKLMRNENSICHLSVDRYGKLKARY